MLIVMQTVKVKFKRLLLRTRTPLIGDCRPCVLYIGRKSAKIWAKKKIIVQKVLLGKVGQQNVRLLKRLPSLKRNQVLYIYKILKKDILKESRIQTSYA